MIPLYFRNNYQKGYGITPFLLMFLFASSYLYPESKEDALRNILDNKSSILYSSKLFDINPVVLSAIIFTERTLNFDWTDQAFDVMIAELGQNSSIGFCQVKLKTAYFIETQLTDSTGSFYCGKKYSRILDVSENPAELINKLENDSLNIQYAAAYLRIIQSYWSKNGYSIDDKPDIIGSLYQLGLFNKPRLPHFNPVPNEFGRLTLESLTLFEEVFSNQVPPLFNN